jgi:pullulanase/glycogen debranching enzyme
MAITFSRGSVNDAGVEKGKSFPLGPACQADGVSFSVYSKDGTAVELLLFDRPDDPRPSRAIRLDRAKNRTYYYWHVFVPGLRARQIYGYRVEGPYEPEEVFVLTPPRCTRPVREGRSRARGLQPPRRRRAGRKRRLGDEECGSRPRPV